MDLENKNDVLDAEKTVEVEETEKAIDSFLNGSVYAEEEEKASKAESKFVTSKEAIVCSISLFALVTWGFSVYGAILVSVLALLGMIFINAGTNAKQVCVSNVLTVATFAAIRFFFSAIQIFVQTYYFYVLEKSVTTKFSNTMTLMTNLVSFIVFIIFVVNAIYLASKKHTPIFSGVAKKFAEREE